VKDRDLSESRFLVARGSAFSRSRESTADNSSVAMHESRISSSNSPDAAAHCPFLNRADSRCSENFNLDRLGYAFRYCFDKYRTCPNYLELLVERRLKRATGAVLHNADGKDRFSPDRLVQLTVRARDISDGYAQHAAGL
jgi:hypothetical protein